MIVSPCGWYCLDDPGDAWFKEDQVNGILISHKETSSRIFITSARKDAVIQEHDLHDLHEKEVANIDFPHIETTVENVSEEIHAIHSLLHDPESYLVVAHLAWGHYCVRFELIGELNSNIQESILQLKYLIGTLQPLTVD